MACLSACYGLVFLWCHLIYGWKQKNWSDSGPGEFLRSWNGLQKVFCLSQGWIPTDFPVELLKSCRKYRPTGRWPCSSESRTPQQWSLPGRYAVHRWSSSAGWGGLHSVSRRIFTFEKLMLRIWGVKLAEHALVGPSSPCTSSKSTYILFSLKVIAFCRRCLVL